MDASLEDKNATSEHESDNETAHLERMYQRDFAPVASDDDPESSSSEEESEETSDGDDFEENEFIDDDAIMARIARGSNKGRYGAPATFTDGAQTNRSRRGPLKAVEPGPEFKHLHSEATSAFIDANYERAVILVKQAIHLNPEIFAAHSLLSEIFLAQGQKQKALAALFSGAHTRPRDPTVWLKVAELILERASDDRTAALKDVLYCYSRVIDIDQKFYDVRFERSAIYRELGYNGRAAQEYERILKDLPYNTRAVRHLAEIYIELDDIPKAKAQYESFIAHYSQLNLDEVHDFNWSDVNIYIELFSHEHKYKEGISSLKSLSRWLLGRQQDTNWDNVTNDDREWDAEDYPRRSSMPWFVPGQYSVESYGSGLPLELRVKLGVYRLKLGIEYIDEALSHFNWLEPEDSSPEANLFGYGDLFREAGDALEASQLYEHALRFYVPLQSTQEYADTSLFLAMASCYDACGDEEEAERCYLTVAEYDKTNIEARIKLAKFYEKMKMTEQALKYITEAADIGRQEHMPRRKQRYGSRIEQLVKEFQATDDELQETADQGSHVAVSPAEDSLVPEKPPLAFTISSHAPKNESGKPEHGATDGWQVRYLYKKLLELQPFMREGHTAATEDWLDIAYTLLRDFRTNRVFFPVQRRMKFLGYSRDAQQKAGKSKSNTLLAELQEIADRIQAAMGKPEIDQGSIPNDYYGISFDSWLDIFLEYSLVLAGQGQAYETYDTLGAAADASIWYHSKTSTRQIHVCWFTCALRLRDEEALTNTARWFIKEYQFVTDTYRLFSILFRACGNPQRSLFHASPSVKFMLRQVKAVDFLLPSDPAAPVQRDSIFQERAALASKDASSQETPVEGLDVPLLVLYGHILYAGNSFTNALNYFFRAYALVPDNPAVLLSIALSYIHHSLKRQSDNRHYLIMQGLSFLEEYRRVRENSSVLQEKQEVEFNFARVWQMLGLAHLATEYYHKCLELGEEIERKRQAIINQNKESMMDLDQQGTQEEEGEQEWEQWRNHPDCVEDFSRQAAYALQGLYVFSGDLERAKKVTERWLVI
ncbi:transcription factor TFIIIC subunit tfc4 [Myotisia sp. PD_48]|nr:transcription factor TFIIIC subunit tfc4 [Myotisia sp. PD_48]